MRVKENIKIDKSLCRDLWEDFFDLTIITLGTSNFDLKPTKTIKIKI
jgi:hypothetical protein